LSSSGLSISNEQSARTQFHTFSPDFEKRYAEAFARQMALKSGCVPRTRWEKENQVKRMLLLTLGVLLKSHPSDAVAHALDLHTVSFDLQTVSRAGRLHAQSNI
jgi:hypothetical protein